MLLCGVEATFRNVQRSRIPSAAGRKVARRCRKAMCQPDDTGPTCRRCAPNLPALPCRTSNLYFIRKAATRAALKLRRWQMRQGRNNPVRLIDLLDGEIRRYTPRAHDVSYERNVRGYYSFSFYPERALSIYVGGMPCNIPDYTFNGCL